MARKPKNPDWPENLMRRGEVWYVKFMYQGRLYKMSTHETTVTRAKTEARRLINDIKDRARGAKRQLTFHEWAKEYQEAYSSMKSDPDRDRQIITHALPVFGSKLLQTITPSMCQGYLQKRKQCADNPKGEPLADGTIQKERNLLQAMFQRAIENGLLTENPWRFIKRTKYKTRDRVLSKEEQERIEAICTPWFRRWLRFMLGTGLRLSECRQLRSGAFDWEQNYVVVLGKGKKERKVPMMGGAVEAAKEQFEAEGHYWPEDESLFRKELYRYAELAGLQPVAGVVAPGSVRKLSHGICPHALRHTFATRFLQAGGNIFMLSHILGHSSVKITETVYAHLDHQDYLNHARAVNL